MNVITVNPNEVQRDEMNERSEDEAEVSDDFVENIKQVGIAQPPLVRENSDGYKVVVGQRRVLAAQQAALDEMPVIVMDWSDEEALKASIAENIGSFRRSVGMQDRAEALKRLWEMMGGSGMPTRSHLADEIGVARETVRTWLEPLNEKWEGTSLDPETDDEPSGAVESLGERSLAEIRRMTGGGEEGEEAAEKVADAGLTQPEIQETRDLVEQGLDVDRAIEEVQSDEDSTLEASVRFSGKTEEAITTASEELDKPPAIVISDAVEWFLESEGYL